MNKIKGLFIIIILISFCLNLGAPPAQAQTADEFYNRAVNKYFLGDNQGALKDLHESLMIDPNYAKAKELISEIEKEIGKAAPPPPPSPKVEEKPKPSFLRPYQVPSKPRAKRPVFMPQPLPQVSPMPMSLIRSLIFWIILALVLSFALTARLIYFYAKEFIAKRSMQSCSECKWVNPSDSEFCSKCGARLKPWTGVTAAQRKWFAKFGWKRDPFTLDIMPNLFTGYQTQVNSILERIHLKSGHILVRGNKGVGKTTLLKWLADKLKEEFHAIYVPRPTDNFDDLLEFLATSLKAKKRKGGRFTIYDLEAIASSTKKNILLLLDEAHEFTSEFERPLRTLGDLNGVNFVLAGLMETLDKIKSVSAPFYDRITLEVILDHLSLKETEELIRKRIEDVGGSDLQPFTPEAVENVFNISSGIPRKILKVCEWIMLDAIQHDLNTIGETAAEAFKEEDVKPEENTK